MFYDVCYHCSGTDNSYKCVSKTQYPPYGDGQISDLGDPLGAPSPKGEKTCPGPIFTIMPNFTPISATVAEIAVTGQREKTEN